MNEKIIGIYVTCFKLCCIIFANTGNEYKKFGNIQKYVFLGTQQPWSESQKTVNDKGEIL